MDIEMKSVPLPSVEAPNPVTSQGKSQRKRGRRGAPSAKAKDEAFRTRVGSRVQNEFKTKITSAHPDIGETESLLARLMTSSNPVTVELPTTLRSFGFMVRRAYQKATDELKVPNPLTLNAFYRLCLAQVQLQMIRSEYINEGVAKFPLPKKQRLISPWANFDEDVARHPATLSAVANLINMVGSFTHDGTRFRPAVREAAFVIKDSSTNPRKRSRSGSDDIASNVYGPDPYVTTLTNLRSTVEQLSDEGTPAAVREYYRMHNSIPGARWDGDLLINANEIIPPVYGSSQLRADFDDLESLLTRLPGRASYLVGSVNFDGHGSPAQLVNSSGGSVYIDGNVESDGCGRSTSSYHLPDHIMFGGTLLHQEYPDYSEVMDPQALSDYANRSSRIAARCLDLDWLDVAQTVLQRPSK